MKTVAVFHLTTGKVAQFCALGDDPEGLAAIEGAFPGHGVHPCEEGVPGSGMWYVQDGRLVEIRSLDDLKAQKVLDIDNAFARAASALTDGYPEAERLTWPTQQAEALAWAADPSAPTPYLDGIAGARGIDLVEMRQKTLGAVQAFMAGSQSLVGTRQRLRDLVNAAATEGDVAAVAWPT